MPRARHTNIGRRTRHASQQQVYLQKRENEKSKNDRLRQTVTSRRAPLQPDQNEKLEFNKFGLEANSRLEQREEFQPNSEFHRGAVWEEQAEFKQEPVWQNTPEFEERLDLTISTGLKEEFDWEQREESELHREHEWKKETEFKQEPPWEEEPEWEQESKFIHEPEWSMK